MRVAHILPWPGIGGTEHSTHQLAGFLKARDHSVVVYHLPEAVQTAGLMAASGFATATYRSEFPSYRHPWNYLRASMDLARDLRRRRVQIVHCADLLAAYHAGLAAKLARLPLLCHIRCVFDHLSKRDQSFLWPVDHFAFISKAVRDGFAYRAAVKRGTVIYTGFSIPVFKRDEAAASLRKEFGIPDTDAVIGMAARIAELKDFHTFARAAGIVLRSHPNVRFLLVGDYSQPQQQTHYARVRQWLNDYGVSSQFIFTGHRNDATRVLAGMDISVLCTHSEGFGRVIVEAMAQGTPVVGTAIDGVPEIIRHGSNGLMHAHEDHEDLARCLAALLDDSGYAARLAAAGKIDAAERFSADAFVLNIESLYKRLT